MFMTLHPNEAQLTSELALEIEGIRWATSSAERGVFETFHPAEGHTHRVKGSLKLDLLVDRIDRVFQTGEYIYSGDLEASTDDSRLYESLSVTEIDSMPTIKPGTVIRDDLRQSTRWVCGNYCIYPQSFGATDFFDLKWSQLRSKIKQEIARTPHRTLDQPGVQLALALDLQPPVHTSNPTDPSSSTEISVILAYRSVADRIEVGLGVPRYNADGGSPWHTFIELDKWNPNKTIVSSGGSPTPPKKLSKNVAVKKNLQRRSEPPKQA